MTFYDVNLYAVKREAIESTMKKVFTAVALCGLVLRLVPEVWEIRPDRSQDSTGYFIFCLRGLLAGFLLVWGLTVLCNQLAEWQWKPKVVEEQRKSFVHAKCIAEQLEQAKCKSEQDRRLSDREAAGQELDQIEKFWGIEPSQDLDLKKRVERLQPMFTK